MRQVFSFILVLLLTSWSNGQVPTITSFSPDEASVGNTVIVTGTNFSPTPSENVVYFGPVRGLVIDASSTTLSVRVPSGATYAPITVVVNSRSASSHIPFLKYFNIPTAFGPPVHFETGGAGRNLLAADLDADGAVDVVVAKPATSTLSVWRNVTVSSSPRPLFQPVVDWRCQSTNYARYQNHDLSLSGIVTVADANPVLSNVVRSSQVPGMVMM